MFVCALAVSAATSDAATRSATIPYLLYVDSTWRYMAPEQREEIRQQFRVFMRLPATERENLIESYRRYSNFSPERRNELRKAYQSLVQLSPEQRRLFLDKLSQWRQLTPDQREGIRLRLRNGPGRR